jgi:hypothetical protein
VDCHTALGEQPVVSISMIRIEHSVLDRSVVSGVAALSRVICKEMLQEFFSP